LDARDRNRALSPVIRRNVRLLSVFNFCLDFRIYAAIAVVYFAHVTGSYALAVLVFSLAKIASTVFEVPSGVFSDFAGRKATLIVGQVASIISIAAYAVADDFAVLAGGAVFGRNAKSATHRDFGSYLGEVVCG